MKPFHPFARGNRARTSNPSTGPARRSRTQPAAGYILLELVIALSIFAIAVLGLANSLSTSVEVANILNRENAIQIGMRSFIEELREKKLADMATSVTDPALNVTYTSEMEELGLRTGSGNTLRDLYNLKVTALYTFAGEERTDTVSVYVYKPQQR
jgi:type II secretory pathway pseudopilin PulG